MIFALKRRNYLNSKKEGVIFELERLKIKLTIKHACNPNYSGGSNQEDGGLRPAPAQRSRGSISTNIKKTKKLCMMACTCHSS
jgi:hypothetical protein